MSDFILIGSAVVLLVVTAIFLIDFLLEPWYRHPFGQSVVLLSAGVILLSSMGLLTYIFGYEYAAREWLVGIGRLVIAAAMIQRIYALHQARRQVKEARGRHARDEVS